jgi:hypothetical protein
VDYIYWPDAPTWALDQLGDYLADMHERHGIRLEAPTFLPYPDSYGDSRVRFTFAQWRNFYGVCGHQHVPENDHGDPGDIDIDRVLARARGVVEPKPKSRGRNIDHAVNDLTAAAKANRSKPVRFRRIKAALAHLTAIREK